MPDEVSFNSSLGIIEVNSYGVVTQQDILDSIAIILQLQERHSVDLLLVDTTKQDSLPNAFEIFEVFSRYPREIRTALLVAKTQATAKDMELVENVALNRGKFVRIFHDSALALTWLKKQ